MHEKEVNQPRNIYTIDELLQENRTLREHNLLLQEQLQKETEKARKDHLTNAYNREGLEQRMRTITEDYSVILIDIDHFKIINDTYGHDKGDEVLRRLCNRLLENIRKEDILVRYGGEEFIIIMPGCDAIAARHKTEYFQDIIGTEEFHQGLGLPNALTFSAGIAYATAEEPFHKTISKADERLYIAKKTRNTICC
ncbi:MAG: GGDEF domain-containing protein [Nanoarchaeota archaeon]